MTHCPPPNINDNKTFPNLTQNPQSHSSSNKTDSQFNSTDNISNNQLSSFLIEFKQLINPLIQLLTTVINKLFSHNDK
jgi:transposase